MKKPVLSLMALIACGTLFAQSIPTVTVKNFTATTSTGQTYTLYTELDKGKTIVIDLWYNECGFCKQYAATVEQAYIAHGSGTGNVDFWALNVLGQSNASVNAYKTQWGVTNKCFAETSGDLAASAVTTSFYPNGGTFATPVYVVVCPNKKGWWNVNRPPSATGFNSYITYCVSTVSGVDNIVRDETKARFVSIYPNPSENASKIDFFIAESGKVEITMFNLLGEQIGVLANEKFDMGTHTIDLTTSVPAGNYFIKMITENGITDVAKFVVVN